MQRQHIPDISQILRDNGYKPYADPLATLITRYPDLEISDDPLHVSNIIAYALLLIRVDSDILWAYQGGEYPTIFAAAQERQAAESKNQSHIIWPKI